MVSKITYEWFLIYHYSTYIQGGPEFVYKTLEINIPLKKTKQTVIQFIKKIMFFLNFPPFPTDPIEFQIGTKTHTNLS